MCASILVSRSTEHKYEAAFEKTSRSVMCRVINHSSQFWLFKISELPEFSPPPPFSSSLPAAGIYIPY
jgi:hypothetical protein